MNKRKSFFDDPMAPTVSAKPTTSPGISNTIPAKGEKISISIEPGQPPKETVSKIGMAGLSHLEEEAARLFQLTPIDLGWKPTRESAADAARQELEFQKQMHPTMEPSPVKLDYTQVKPVHTGAAFHNIQTKAGQRVAVVDVISADGQELNCYSFTHRTMIHLKKSDLVPLDVVNEAIQTISDINRHQKNQ